MLVLVLCCFILSFICFVDFCVCKNRRVGDPLRVATNRTENDRADRGLHVFCDEHQSVPGSQHHLRQHRPHLHRSVSRTILTSFV